MNQDMHHLHFTKVAVKNVPPSLHNGNATIRRSVWSTVGFDAHCEDNNGINQGTCSCCSCPPLALPGETPGCDTGIPITNISCDAVTPGNGRLAVLRLNTIFACYADCAPNPSSSPPGVLDGVVNIDDLVVVITHWGQTGSGIWGDTTDNGVVNIDDLVTVITTWGTCAHPINGGGGAGGGGQVPQSVNDYFDACSGSEEWSTCLQKCLESLCIRGITEGCQ